MKNIIVFKIDKDIYEQWGGAIENIWYAKEIYPYWICRFFVINIKPNDYTKKILELGGELIFIDTDHNKDYNWPNIIYHSIYNDNVNSILVRNIGSRLSYHDRMIVYPNEKINGNLFRHCKQKFHDQELDPEKSKFIYFHYGEQKNNGGFWIYSLIKNMIKYSKYKTTNILNKASIVITLNENIMKEFITKHPNNNKKLLIYCAEPRLSLVQKNIIYFKKKKINVMNCYTKNVFVNQLHDAHHIFKFDHFNQTKMKKWKFNNKKIAVIASNRRNTDMIYDLTDFRYKLVMNGYNRNLIDVYGAGWPKGISKGQTRFIKDIYGDKLNTLNLYYFNLCLENTNIDNYVTEKIWHSIISGCLPIYFGNSEIYKIFPKKSFIDCKGKSVKQILDQVKNMAWDEYIKRFNKCYDVVKEIKWMDIIKTRNTRKKLFLDMLKKIDN